jgi:hypothetical protein
LHRHNRSSNGASAALKPLPPAAALPELELAARAPVAPPPAAPAPPVAEAAHAPATQQPPALPFNLSLRGQFTAADSRADRLVRQVRGEVADLRHALDHLSLENADLMEVDIAAVIADPATAAALPPAALVRAIVAAGQRGDALESQLAMQKKKASRLRAQLREQRLEDAAARARVETLGEVIAALHDNLEDLRAERDHARSLLSAPAPRAALRAAPGERSALVECD